MYKLNYCIRTLTCLGVIAFSICAHKPKPSDNSLKELEYVVEMIVDDIAVLKRKIWSEIPAQIYKLNEELEYKAHHMENCSCGKTIYRAQNENASNEHSASVPYLTMLKAFQLEKRKSRLIEERLNNDVRNITELINELMSSKMIMKHCAEKVEKNKETNPHSVHMIMDVQRSINELKDSYNTIRHDLQGVNGTLFNLTGKSTDKSAFQQPSFISDWILMQAQDKENSQIFVQHDSGVLPYKVEVQIRPTSGWNSGWIFPGDSSYQSDDDTARVYGGVVYLYNETHVILSVPVQHNNKNTGTIINTGSSESMRIGNYHQTADDSYVRIKVWKPADLPTPQYKSEWLPLDITNRSLTYYELQHELDDYPGLITVQIRCSSPDGSVISEGVGTSIAPINWSNAGGVVWAFSDTSVRLWTGFRDKYTMQNMYTYYALLGTTDGWGPPPLQGGDYTKGEFRILAWNREKLQVYEHFERNINFPELHAGEHISSNTDLLSFYVEANDGQNRGFRFRGYGSSQSTIAPFGGVVYAFHPTGVIRVWRPNPSANGHLVLIHPAYGNGRNVQVSDNATYISTLLKSN